MNSITGTVTALTTAQTAVVTITTRWQHPLYKKFVKQTKKYLSHYEKVVPAVGDTVVIKEGKPISKRKRFTIIELVPSKAGIVKETK